MTALAAAGVSLAQEPGLVLTLSEAEQTLRMAVAAPNLARRCAGS